MTQLWIFQEAFQTNGLMKCLSDTSKLDKQVAHRMWEENDSFKVTGQSFTEQCKGWV